MNNCNDCLYSYGVFCKADYEEDENDNCLSFESRETYEKGKTDGAREFAEWLTNYAFDHIDYVCYGHFINRQGRQISADEVLAEWQKGEENE